MKQEKQNPFIKYNGIKDAKKHIHKASGLYDASNEHDACGVGMIVDIHGNKSHELVDSALKVLENMKHRGAEGADNKTGDGAGIMLQIPHEFILLQGIPVPEKGKYGTGLVFLPKDGQEQSHMLSTCATCRSIRLSLEKTHWARNQASSKYSSPVPLIRRTWNAPYI